MSLLIENEASGSMLLLRCTSYVCLTRCQVVIMPPCNHAVNLLTFLWNPSLITRMNDKKQVWSMHSHESNWSRVWCSQVNSSQSALWLPLSEKFMVILLQTCSFRFNEIKFSSCLYFILYICHWLISWQNMNGTLIT